MVAWPAVGLKGICFMVSAPAGIPPSQPKGGGEGRTGVLVLPDLGVFCVFVFALAFQPSQTLKILPRDAQEHSK